MASLTADEARARAELIAVDGYELGLDLTGLLTGSSLTGSGVPGVSPAGSSRL